VKGAGRSFINATMRPAGGIVGAIAHPIQGAWRSALNSMVKEQDRPHYHTRVDEGLRAVELSTSGERAEVVRMFKEASRKENVVARKKRITEVAEEVMYESVEEGKKKDGQPESSLTSTPNLASFSTSKETRVDTKDDDRPNAEDASFDRDLELAKRLSLYEQ